MPNFYVIGDVHGCAEELRALVHQLPLDQESTILFLGDYVDRGPDSKGVIDTILDLSELYRVIALRGNHERMMEDFLANSGNAEISGNFILNGGSATLASYSNDGSNYTIPGAHREFLAKLALYHATETHFFVHAGVPPNYDFTDRIDTKTAHQFLWIRSAFLESKVKWPKIVVHGHSPVEAPEILPNRINLDTGCVFGRRLTAMNLATGQLYSVERNRAERPNFLRQMFGGGATRAKRFEGSVPVEIRAAGVAAPFVTVNFNEFGMLVFPEPNAPSLALAVGQKVQGTLRPGGASGFQFEGSVMRTDTVEGKLHFGIRFDTLDSIYEAS